jgi:hypothetical protein
MDTDMGAVAINPAAAPLASFRNDSSNLEADITSPIYK